MSLKEPLRFNTQKRLRSAGELPSNLIKKFIIMENRDSRGRVAFHILFKKSKRSGPDKQIVPRELRVHDSLISAEIAIFNMVEDYIDRGKNSRFSFIGEQTNFKNIITFFKHLIRIVVDK